MENAQISDISDVPREVFAAPPYKLGGWSRKHAACVGCGTTERKHASRGLCVACYARAARYVARNRAKS